MAEDNISKHLAGAKFVGMESDEQTVERISVKAPYYRVEDGRDDNPRSNGKYFHPLIAMVGGLDMTDNYAAYDPTDTEFAKLKAYHDSGVAGNKYLFDSIVESHPEWDEWGWWEEYDVPGCVEEPDAPLVHVLVHRLRESYAPGPLPVVMTPCWGGLVLNDPYFFTAPTLAHYLKCQTISISVRTCYDAPYPAAINDCHAVYQWMVDNAEALNIDLDRVVLNGMSGCGILAASLPFRLKRYGWLGAPMPRGTFIEDGFFDDRETRRSTRVLSNAWNGFAFRTANRIYMGENFASGFVGPEAYANHATVEECKGLCPYIIYEGQDNVGCDHALEFVLKLNEAGVYCSFDMQGGCTHVRPMDPERPGMATTITNQMFPYEPPMALSAASLNERFCVGSLKDLIECDFRRL